MNAIHDCYINYSYYAKKNYDKIILNLKSNEIESTVIYIDCSTSWFFCDNYLTIIFFLA